MGCLFAFMKISEPLVFIGGEVKALDESGRIGGYLVRFSGPDDPDLAGDFFTADTDFGAQKSTPVLYQHAQDSHLKSAILGSGELKTDDVGVWVEAQLTLRDEYEQAIFEMAKAGKLGWSSGTAAHLVEREAVGKSWWIKSWPLGLDASLTPTPAEPRIRAIPLKTYPEALQIQEVTTTEAAAVAVSVTEDEAVKVQPEVTVEQSQETPQAQEAKSAPAPAIITPTPSEVVTVSVDEYKKLIAGAATPTANVEEVKGAFESSATLNLKTKPGDSEAKALAYWIRHGDMGAVKSMQPDDNGEGWGVNSGSVISVKASNDTDMNIGTAADGGNAVPTGHFNGIIARRDESRLSAQLGVRNIPGVGTTVNVPLDAEDDGEFISTAEAAASDRDAPALGTKALTLAKYTKRVELSDELMQDEESRLMEFLNDFIGRGMAKTHNDLLITEVETNGTNFKTFASATAIADGELEDIEGDDDLGAYLDDASVAWVMRNSTLAAIRKISGSDRVYGDEHVGGPNVASGRSLIGYPVYRSNKAETIATGNKSVLFGNWFFVGMREAPEFRILRDPYSAANTGQLRLHYYFRTVYGVLQAEAIGYGTQA